MALNIILKPFHLALLTFACKNYTLGFSFMVFSLCVVYLCMKERRKFFFLFNQTFRLIAGYYHYSTPSSCKFRDK